MTPLTLTLILASTLSLITSTETANSAICYRKDNSDERTTKLIRTTCVEEVGEQPDVLTFDSPEEFSLTALYRFLEDSRSYDDSRKVAYTSNREGSRLPCITKHRVQTSVVDSAEATNAQDSGSLSKNDTKTLSDVTDQSVSAISLVEPTIANQSGSSLESLSECFLDVTEQSIASTSFDFMENPNLTGDDLAEYLFAFTFIDIYCPNTAARQIYIGTTRLTGTSGRIYFPSQNVSDIYFVLGPGEEHFLQLPANYQRPHEDDSGLLLNSTVVVTANDSVVIYAYQGCADELGQQASAFRVQERQRLGTDYWVLTYFRKSPAHLGIVAVENNTSVAISFNHTNGNFEMRQQDITMNMYDTFYLVLPFDVTGTQITSNKKVSVIVGVSSIILSQVSRNSEPFCETLEPIFNWGKAFSVAHFLGPEKSNDYIVKFISAVDNNTVHWKQGPYKTETTLQKGQSKELLVTANITDVLEINSSKNILVAQFATRGDPVFTNPAMTFIPPHTDGLEDKILFPIFDLSYEGNVTNYLTVWVPPMEHLSNISIDSICTEWRIFGGHDSGWKVFKKALKAGSHILRVKNGFKVRAMVFSAAQKSSCAYPIA